MAAGGARDAERAGRARNTEQGAGGGRGRRGARRAAARPPGYVLLLSPSTMADAAQQWEDGERRKKKMTCGARESVVGERVFNAIYVFVYTCSWAQVVSICIPWHFCEKRKIVMVYFEIDE